MKPICDLHGYRGCDIGDCPEEMAARLRVFEALRARAPEPPSWLPADTEACLQPIREEQPDGY